MSVAGGRSDEIAFARLCNQGVSTSRFATAEDVVGWLLAMQSQEYAVARWSIGQRCTGVDHTDVDRALADGSILRTHVLRPTWHFVLREDISWILALSAPRVHAVNASYYRKFGLDASTLARTTDLIVAALANGNHLTREDIAVVLERAEIAASSLRLGYILMYAELERVICSGAPQGKQRTYALFDERVPRGAAKDQDEALALLAGRYFASHGPATLNDFRWWSGLRAGEARRALELARSAGIRLNSGSREYWSSSLEPCPPGEAPRAHLLQGYDETIIAYRESKDVLNPEKLRSVLPGGTPFIHAVLIDSRFAGHWRRLEKGSRTTVEIQAMRPLDRSERKALAEAAERMSLFLGAPVTAAVVYEAP